MKSIRKNIHNRDVKQLSKIVYQAYDIQKQFPSNYVEQLNDAIVSDIRSDFEFKQSKQMMSNILDYFSDTHLNEYMEANQLLRNGLMKTIMIMHTQVDVNYQVTLTKLVLNLLSTGVDVTQFVLPVTHFVKSVCKILQSMVRASRMNEDFRRLLCHALNLLISFREQAIEQSHPDLLNVIDLVQEIQQFYITKLSQMQYQFVQENFISLKAAKVFVELLGPEIDPNLLLKLVHIKQLYISLEDNVKYSREKSLEMIQLLKPVTNQKVIVMILNLLDEEVAVEFILQNKNLLNVVKTGFANIKPLIKKLEIEGELDDEQREFYNEW
ncbi:Hypothetical_protein [Hexamita inflata]|uniref:Hypothetical_protein n=1 Tax=Hexamita inflata TaxID=28002 RepID=A0AA86UXE2_9EUKA|nr:Hypothetical protein HINF_LOCUS12125 [Hexamita inflata]CAI9971814.1 Hypothetical protein HINF_LOCUS59459 [Hexamita inflata]